MTNPFGKYLKALLGKYGQGQSDIARALEVSVPYVSDVIRGLRAPFTPEKIELLCQALGLQREESIELHTRAVWTREKTCLLVDHSRDDIRASGLLSATWVHLNQGQLDELANLLESWT